MLRRFFAAKTSAPGRRFPARACTDEDVRVARLSERQTRLLAGVTALLIPSEPRLPHEVRARVLDYTERFVALQVENLPTYLRAPYLIAMVGFQWLPVLRFGRRFLDLPFESQRAYLTLWSEAPLAPMRDFVRLIRNCALLAYYDHPDVCRALGAGVAERYDPADRGEGVFE